MTLRYALGWPGPDSAVSGGWRGSPCRCCWPRAARLRLELELLKRRRPGLGARRGGLVEERVELEGVVAQPALPEPVIRPAAGHDRPEARSVAEHAQVGRSWITTVSRASGGARISRQLNDSRPAREALPQRVRWSRIDTAVGLTPRAAAWPARAASMTGRARSRQ